MPYKKPCEDCGEKFQPNSPQQKLCDSCWEKKRSGKRKLKEKKDA